jgi:hypothetical protein
VLWIDAGARAGAQGMKVSKSLGLGHRDKDGKLLHIDDPASIRSEAKRDGSACRCSCIRRTTASGSMAATIAWCMRRMLSSSL